MIASFSHYLIQLRYIPMNYKLIFEIYKLKTYLFKISFLDISKLIVISTNILNILHCITFFTMGNKTFYFM